MGSVSDVIDLNAARERLRGDQPDAEHVAVDAHGVRWYRFTCRYVDGDSEHGFDIWATSHEDAARRMEALRATARVDGQVHAWGPM